MLLTPFVADFGMHFCVRKAVVGIVAGYLNEAHRKLQNCACERKGGGVHDKIIVSCLNGSSHCWPRHPTPHRPYLYGTYVCVDGPLPWSRMSSPTFTLLLLHNCDKRLHNNSTTRLVCDTTPPLLSLPSPFQEVSTEWRRQRS